MGVLIKKVRILNFRGLKNIEIELAKTTVLTGMNNSGKTSFLKALQIALGNRQFITHDDFYIGENKIIIDLLIVPTGEDNEQSKEFNEECIELFGMDRIKDDGDTSFIPLRTIVEVKNENKSYKIRQYILKEWSSFEEEGENWYERNSGNEKSFYFEEIPFFYINAQRDILEDTKLKNSYMGKMLSNIEYDSDIISEIEDQIETLNTKVVEESSVLRGLKNTLKDLDSAVGNRDEGVEITPFTKKIRDLNKGLTIHYKNGEESFPMEYHGMGTRSWSSLLTLKSFIFLLNSKSEDKVFFPILAIEEPEAHLHPQAQKKLYNQLKSIQGQKIISTHSPYICASANIKEIRSFYKKGRKVICGQLDSSELNSEGLRQIQRQVINTRGELLFSKVVVFFEGETEEQALPILAKHYFGKDSLELGIDFIGVGGFKKYTPFLRFAKGFNIPWIILSDSEGNVKTGKDSVPEQIKRAKATGELIFLSDRNDFEKELIHNGYQDEIKKAIYEIKEYSNESHRQAEENKYIEEIISKGDDELYRLMGSNKTKFAPKLAEEIVKSGKELPPKIKELFKKVGEILDIEREV